MSRMIGIALILLVVWVLNIGVQELIANFDIFNVGRLDMFNNALL